MNQILQRFIQNHLRYVHVERDEIHAWKSIHQHIRCAQTLQVHKHIYIPEIKFSGARKKGKSQKKINKFGIQKVNAEINRFIQNNTDTLRSIDIPLDTLYDEKTHGVMQKCSQLQVLFHQEYYNSKDKNAAIQDITRNILTRQRDLLRFITIE